jgi:hypothetical protein
LHFFTNTSNLLNLLSLYELHSENIIHSCVPFLIFSSPERPNTDEEIHANTEKEESRNYGGNHQGNEGSDDAENIKNKRDDSQDNPRHQKTRPTLGKGNYPK